MANHDLLVPLAGRGSRMLTDVPKPMIMAGSKTILEWGMDSIDYSQSNLIFVILREQVQNWGLDAFLKTKYPGLELVILDDITRGSVESCYHAKPLLGRGLPLTIFAPDVMFAPKFQPDEHFSSSGRIFTFKANSPNYSYILRDAVGNVSETREKEVISQEAAVGLYSFGSGHIFLDYAERMMKEDLKSHGEFFICPMYNLMIQDRLLVHATQLDTVHIMGTADELAFFEQNVEPFLNGPSKWILCSDHSGYLMKEAFKKCLKGRNMEFIDVGCHSSRDCDRYDFMKQATKLVNSIRGSIGVAFCRSGQGMNIEANKQLGIRSALVRDGREAGQAVRHNAANFFSVPAQAEIDKIVAGIQSARFEGGRHQNRLMKVGA